MKPQREKRDKPTPQTLKKLKRDVIEGLVSAGKLRDVQGQAAMEINDILGAIGRGLFPAARNLDTAGRPPRHSRKVLDPIDRMTREETWAYQQHYKPWANREGLVPIGPATRLELAIQVVWDNSPLKAVEDALRIRHGAAIGHLQESLHDYALLAGWVRR